MTAVRWKQRWLVVHRVLGLGGSALFLAWFVSGFAMMYVEMPYLLRSDAWLDGQGQLVPDGRLVSASAAVETAGLQSTPDRVVLEMQGDQPVWRLSVRRQGIVTLDAVTGARRGPWGVSQARELAAEWARWDGPLVFDRTLDLDQWTISDSMFAAHRPLHRFRVDGASSAQIYVSQKTGKVVQVTTGRERLLAYLGPVTHWIYPTVLRRRASLWSNSVTVLASLGVVAVLSGGVLGVWNLRRRNGRLSSPYRPFWLRWHHLLGLAFGAVSLTWIFSGLLSMGPLDWSPSTRASTAERRAFSDHPGNWSAFALQPEDALATLPRDFVAKQLEARFVGGTPFWIAWETPKTSLAIRADKASAQGPHSEVPESLLRQSAEALQPGIRLDLWQRLDDYDNFYYSKRAFRNQRRLPVYRATFSDPARTTYYIDPHRGGLELKLVPRSRLNRYLYNGLHSWDFGGFFNSRPWWDITVGTFLLGGTAGALSAVALTLLWFRRRLARS